MGADARNKSSHLTVLDPRCEYQAAPLGIDVRQPRLSWKLASEQRDARQSAYRILVADSVQGLANDRGNLWDSGKVASDASIQRDYQGSALGSRQRCYWKVQVWDEDDQPTAWSEPASWEMGLLQARDWGAAWIAADIPEDKTTMQPCPMLRTEFNVVGGVRSARIYVTSLGNYELHLDGSRVGDAYFTPGWTSYTKRLQYQTYDVSAQLTAGDHALGALLADGWYRGYIALTELKRNFYGDTLALLLQLVIEYNDGRVQVVGSDGTWRAATGPILEADHFMGERYDARLEKPGWTMAGYDDRDWSGVVVLDQEKSVLVAQTGPPVRVIEEIDPQSILRTPKGETVVDFGQNMVGWVRMRVSGSPGTQVTLRHAEVLDSEGNFYTENLRRARQTNTYILKGGDEEVYEPRFTFQGFRYVAVEGYPGQDLLESLTGVVLHSDLPPTGSFECSNPLVNQLQHNIVWGLKGNFLEVPTDCPQRDERMGWTGDAQIFTPTASFNKEVAGFFTRWLRDLVADQRQDGAYPYVAPNTFPSDGYGATGWADAGVIIPWELYLSYGDKRILEENYAAMRRWIGYMRQRAGEDLVWRGDFHFGDWLATDRNDLGTPFGITETDLLATAFFAHSTGLVAKIAAVLGRDEEAGEYRQLGADIRRAFQREFVTPNGRVGTNTQTAYVLTLMFDLLPENQRAEAVRRLVADIRARDDHLSTGLLGSRYLSQVLTDAGQLDVAYDLLLQDTCPSWLYPVKLGATTIWERWDGIKADGSFQNAGMNSFNHYAYGAIGHWLYSVVAGIATDPGEPGYKHAVIHPHPGGGLTYARAALNTMYGELASHWELDGASFELQVSVPANTSATIILPAGQGAGITQNGAPLVEAAGIHSVHVEEGETFVKVGSGRYDFRVVT